MDENHRAVSRRHRAFSELRALTADEADNHRRGSGGKRYAHMIVHVFAWTELQPPEDMPFHVAMLAAISAMDIDFFSRQVGVEITKGKDWHEALLGAAEQLAQVRAARLKGARVKLETDPKQAAKVDALALWKEWKNAKHPRLRTTEQFAIEVMRRWPVLESAKVICGWSARWNKATKAGNTPAR